MAGRAAMADPLRRLAALDWPASIAASVTVERWPLRKPFVISRGVEREAALVVVELRAGDTVGRGECCPVPRYGESVGTVVAEIGSMLTALENGDRWTELHDRLPAGAARNAVDCAVWDLAAKWAIRRAHEILALPEPAPVETVLTISLATPGEMAEAARAAVGHPSLKLKLGGENDAARVAAVRAAVPDKQLIADVNEAWSPGMLAANMPAMRDAGLAMLEQPLPAGDDDALGDVDHLVPIGADESCHTTADLDRVAPLYDVVNIKLDKTGGLTEALRLLEAAQKLGLQTMVGCMLGTSLAMAPAHLVAQRCAFVDLDAPLLIGDDRPDGLHYGQGRIAPPDPALWG